VSIEDDIAFLLTVPTLQALGPGALRIIAIGAESRYVHGGEVLFRRGDAADAGYVVQEGLFSLNATPEDSTKEVAMGPGSLIGELALIKEMQRPVTATAIEPSTVIRIPRTLFLKMLEGYPEAAARLRDALAARVQETARDMIKIRSVLDEVEKKG
jgi:CRP-like cAMP-binding protein